MDAGIFLLRKRYHEHPEWFRSDRIVFIDSIFTQLWLAKYDIFNISANPDGTGRVAPPNAMDLFTGEHPKFLQNFRVWGIDVDEIYTVLNLGSYHWVALLINVHQRHILVWDSIVGVGGKAAMEKALQAMCVMLAYVCNLCAPPEYKHLFPNVPYTWEVAPAEDVPQAASGDCGFYTLKYIECHSLGIPFSEKDFAPSAVKRLREKMAVEVFDEVRVTGTEPINYEGLDMYDCQLKHEQDQQELQ